MSHSSTRTYKHLWPKRKPVNYHSNLLLLCQKNLKPHIYDVTSPVTAVSLTCGATALVLYVDGFFALALSRQAGTPQCAAAPVCQPVGAAHLVVALARAHAHFFLLVLVASDAL